MKKRIIGFVLACAILFSASGCSILEDEDVVRVPTATSTPSIREANANSGTHSYA